MSVKTEAVHNGRTYYIDVTALLSDRAFFEIEELVVAKLKRRGL
jgi:hypothetical protein